MATAVTPPVTPKTTTSVDPLYTAAVAQAKAGLAAETAPITAEQNASDAQFQQRQTDATGVAAALSKLLQPIGPAVNDIYQTAGQNQELAANGFSQGMQDALKGNTDNLNAMLKSLGQHATLDSHAGQAGDVLYGLGGYTPGTAFAKEGAAFGSAAELQAGDAILKGQENVKDLQAKAIVADQGFQAKIDEMAGKLPGDVQSNYMKLQQLSLDDAKFREQVRKDNIDTAYKTATLKLDNAKYRTSISEFNANYAIKVANAKLAAQRVSIEATRAANAQYNADRSYAVKLANLGIAQKKLQMTITANAFKAANGGYTKQALTKLEGQALAMAQGSYHGSKSTTTTYDIHGNPITTQSKTKVNGGVPYFQALTTQLKKGMPVQLALSALDQVYPAGARPTDEALNKYLGPLTPDAIRQQVQVNSGTPFVAGAAMTDPTAVLTHGRSMIVQIAKGMLGTPYVWGGNTPGKSLDCSGFVCQVFKQVGVNLPRTTEEQVKVGAPVSLQQLQPGDLVFTEPGASGPKHVGLYVGNGEIQESPHSGDVNKFIPLQSFLGGGFVAARRVLP